MARILATIRATAFSQNVNGLIQFTVVDVQLCHGRDGVTHAVLRDALELVVFPFLSNRLDAKQGAARKLVDLVPGEEELDPVKSARWNV